MRRLDIIRDYTDIIRGADIISIGHRQNDIRVYTDITRLKAGYHFYKVQHIVAKMAEYINFADSLYCVREGK